MDNSFSSSPLLVPVSRKYNFRTSQDKSRGGSAVGIATGYRLDDRGVAVRDPVGS
jgi:hypothetical protein